MDAFEIRKSTVEDKEQMFKLFMEVANQGEAFMHDESTTFEQWDEFWNAKDAAVFVVTINNEIVASYKLRPNQPGRGKHVANGGYMVSSNHFGRGIGKMIGEHSIQQAKFLGYKAIQFNAVVSTNIGAVKLWENLGFKIVGTNPNTFYHIKLGYVDTYTMYLSLA